ncbi:MAG: STAS domain-containing protein [Halomonas sp.]|nr:STAS domain-containing protein [Halomonas sp.]TVP48816.1 MAG: STAS domain-containing protein [Halomonas sp.]
MTVLFTRPSVTVQVDDATLSVAGDVDVTLAADLAASGVKWLQTAEITALSLDFSGVNKASSVAISVLFEWLRTCQKCAIKVEAIHLSVPLERLASLAELDDLIEHPASALMV